MAERIAERLTRLTNGELGRLVTAIHGAWEVFGWDEELWRLELHVNDERVRRLGSRASSKKGRT